MANAPAAEAAAGKSQRGAASRVQDRGVTGACTVLSGKWRSYYDRRTWRQVSAVDVDHLVPLHETWGSGAKRWNANTRQRFANDLRDRRALVAVTDNVNQSKGADIEDVGAILDGLAEFKRAHRKRTNVNVLHGIAMYTRDTARGST